MKRTPDEKQIQELLENTLPIPGSRLDKNLSTAPWNSRMVARRRFFVTVTLAIMIVVAIIVATPQGHAWAQELLNYFTTVSTKSISTFPTQVSAPTLTVETRLVLQENNSVDNQTCEGKISPISSTFFCQLKNAQNKLRFAIKSFSIHSIQAQFEFMLLDQDHGILQMDFKGNDIHYSLTQGLGDFPQDCPGCVIYEGAVQAVRVGAYQAEYAKGAFFFKDGLNNGMEWNPDEPVYQLRWKEDEHWYKLILSTVESREDHSDEEIQEEMIYIAENLVGLNQGVKQLTAGDQPSVKDSIGFTLKEPGLLPEDFFQVSYRGWSNLTTAPRVGMQYDHIINGQWVDSLLLHQMFISSDDYQTLRREFALIYQGQSLVNGRWDNSSTDEEIQINGSTGYYLDAEEANAYALYWRDEEKEYLLIYFWSPEFGGRLDKSTLIKIAENLR